MQKGHTVPERVVVSVKRRAVCLAAVLLLCVLLPVRAAASAESSDPDAGVPEVTVSSNSQETLGTVGFAQANTRRIAVGKSTVLYLTIKDMGFDFSTTFESSDETIATVTMLDDRAVKVVGLKSGTVTITAKVDSRSKGLKISRYVLEIGDGGSDTASQGGAVTESGDSQENGGVGIVTDFGEDNDLDLYASTTDPQLLKFAQQRRSGNATSLLLGLIGWSVIIIAGVYVFSVLIRSRAPKMNVSPGSRKRYSAGGSSSLHAGNRLLPSKYYRNLKKY